MGAFLSAEGKDGLASISKVLSLWGDEELETVKDMIWWVGIWVLFSSIFVHFCALLASIIGLYKHSKARWYSLVLLINGFLFPLTVGLLTSCK